MKRFSRPILIFLCVAFLISCMVIPASAADLEPIHSYQYFDFTNLGSVPAGGLGSVKVKGDPNITTNTIYVLASRDSSITINSIRVGSTQIVPEITELWKTGSVCCYRIKTTTAHHFRSDFEILCLNLSGSSVQNFNVYQIFYSGTSGIVSINGSGLTGTYGPLSRDDVAPESFSISHLPYKFLVPDDWYMYSDFYLDIKVPISKFVGFDQGSFEVLARTENYYHLDNVTVLYNNAPYPFVLTNSSLGDQYATYGDLTDDSKQFVSSIDPVDSGYLTCIFDVPEQVSDSSFLTLRFVWEAPNLNPGEFNIELRGLYGRFSFTKTEYQLLTDIYNQLSGLDFDTSELEAVMQQLKTQLHNDLAGIQSSITQSNSLLESIKNNIINFRTQVINGFANVGNWFVTLGNDFSSAIAEWGQNIVDALINTDKESADDFVDKSEQQSSDISDSMDKIDQIVTPDLDDIINPTTPPVDPGDPTDPSDPSVPTEDPASKPVEVLDPETVGSFADVFGLFFENGIFSSIFSFVLLMMLASYVLFGKK